MTKNKNRLQLYRHRMRLSQDQAVDLLGNEVSRYRLSRFENGFVLPSLRVALELEILYRVPIAFCYDEMYHGGARTSGTADARCALLIR